MSARRPHLVPCGIRGESGPRVTASYLSRRFLNSQGRAIKACMLALKYMKSHHLAQLSGSPAVSRPGGVRACERGSVSVWLPDALPFAPRTTLGSNSEPRSIKVLGCTPPPPRRLGLPALPWLAFCQSWASDSTPSLFRASGRAGTETKLTHTPSSSGS